MYCPYWALPACLTFLTKLPQSVQIYCMHSSFPSYFQHLTKKTGQTDLNVQDTQSCVLPTVIIPLLLGRRIFMRLRAGLFIKGHTTLSKNYLYS